MLNATLCATGRAICCLLETYQDVDGVHIPEVLVPYMGGITFLPFVRASRAGDVQKPVAAAASVSGGSATAAPTVAAPAPAQKVEKSAQVAPAVVPATTGAVAAAAQLPPAVQAIVDKITAKGDEIRVLKAAKVRDDEEEEEEEVTG